MLKLKRGVSLLGVREQVLFGAEIVAGVYQQLGFDCIVTSGNDGKHRATSLHYQGQAIDLRTWNVTQRQASKARPLMDKLAEAFGMSKHEIVTTDAGNLVFTNGEYDVVFESIGQDNEHLHVEWQRKKAAA